MIMDCGIDGLTFTRPSLVKPQFAADCDLSNIVRKFIRTGELPQQRMRPNIGSDAAYPVDYQALQDTLAAARSNFELLPQAERDKYSSVEDWLEFKAGEAALGKDDRDEQKNKDDRDEQKNKESQEESLPGSEEVPPAKGIKGSDASLSS